jgi:hypothetical protein
MQTYYLYYLLLIGTSFLLGLIPLQQKKKISPAVWLLGCTLLNEICSWLAGKYYRNNMPVYHVSIPVLTGIWALFYYRNITSIRVKNLVVWSYVIFLLLAIINSLFIQSILQFPGTVFTCLNLLMIAWSAVLMIQMLDAPGSQNLFKEPIFLINIAILWFNLFSFAYFALRNYMIAQHISTTALSQILLIANYVFYSIILLAMIFNFIQNKHESRI